MTAAKKILDQALLLPEHERRRVAERLLDSISRVSREKLEAAWNDEAIHRAEKLERGETRALDGTEALEELERKLLSIHG